MAAETSKAPIVSVVVPSYNHGRFLAATLDSALATTLPIELVVVDDGSSDDSAALLRDWAGREPRLRFFPQANAGAHAALNRGIGLARADLVLILNSDDLFLPGRIETLAAAFAADPDLAFAGSALEVIDHQGNLLGKKDGWRSLPPPWQKKGGLSELGHPSLALLESNYLSTTSNFAFRRSRAAGLEFRPLRYAHDWDFALAMASRGGYTFFDQPLLQYRVHPSNTIKEGAEAGRGLMYFEILWLLAGHAHQLCRRCQPDFPDLDLERQIAQGLPDFGHPELLFTLLAWRGESAAPSAAFLALLEADHPLRQSAIAELAKVAP